MIKLKVGQRVRLEASPLSAEGSKADVESAVWASEGTAGLVLQLSGLECTVWAQSAGLASVSCTADASIGDAVKNIVGGIQIHVVDEEAHSLVIKAGEVS